eukprot:TRINITY_DN17386_c0_g1_i1.p1 TRINITY_DN17386_c0_g1~~TRINITY_DN17386_c0_g1_i1.p1  ORF type:complete len:287 (+),score=76.04 TRINITY_DN17386_c0_g1_i1:295-1155(+)
MAAGSNGPASATVDLSEHLLPNGNGSEANRTPSDSGSIIDEIRTSISNVRGTRPATTTKSTLTAFGSNVHSKVRSLAQKTHEHFETAKEKRSPWQKNLGESLEAKEVHFFLISLLLIDLAAVVYDILEMLHSKAEDANFCLELLSLCKDNPAACDDFHSAGHSDFSFYVSMFILVMFLLNIIGLFIAWGHTFFMHPGYVLDLIVVLTAIILETSFDNDTAGLLAILTMWRLVRVMHGIFEVTDETFEAELKGVEGKLSSLEDLHKKDEAELKSLKEEIAQFKGGRS